MRQDNLLKNDEKTLEFKNKIIDLFKKVLEDNKKEMIEIEVCDEEPTSILQSKFGGIPYTPHNAEIPCDSNGNQLTLLAQINIEELPKNDIYPMKEGILQFFILNNDVYGLSFDEENNIKPSMKVVYYKDLDKSVTEDEVLAKYDPYIENEDDYFPLCNNIFSLKFTKKDGYLTDSCEDLDEKVSAALSVFKEQNYAQYKEQIDALVSVNTITKVLDYFAISSIIEEVEEFDEILFEDKHKIGGHPNYTQNDIRDLDGEPLTLLFQMCSVGTDDKEIMWGDCGIANFFITESDLKALNFDNVIYNWDCC